MHKNSLNKKKFRSSYDSASAIRYFLEAELVNILLKLARVLKTYYLDEINDICLGDMPYVFSLFCFRWCDEKFLQF